jgi:two-component system response regulator
MGVDAPALQEHPVDEQHSNDEPRSRPVILLIADEPSSGVVFLEAAEEAGLGADIQVIDRGVQALTRLRAIARGHAERPALILIDLQPPAHAGEEILGQVRSDPMTAEIPVVLLTTADRFETPAAEVPLPDGYLVKPHEWAQYAAMMDYLKDLIAPTSA